MAYNAQKIAPIDFKPSTAVGVSLPFSGEAVFTPNYTTQEAVKNNLINWFLTNKGERPLNPDFGGNLRRFIFEQISNDNLDLIEDDIQSQLKTYFPSVIVVSLNILAQEDNNAIIVELKYRVQNTNIEDQLTITFD
jgi:phage baseplate assembly protein W